MQQRWKEGCRGMLTVNAIFAGFSGVLLINLVLRLTETSITFYVATGMASAALYCFAIAGEWITDALDEANVDIYIRSMLTYDLGVVCIFVALATFLWEQDRPYLAAIVVALTFYPWFWHLGWFIFSSEETKSAYRDILIKVDS